MSLNILSACDTAALENVTLNDGKTIAELMHEAVQGCFHFVLKHYPKSKFPKAALLAGTGHNGGDALGLGSALLREGRSVTALICNEKSSLKPLTDSMLKEFLLLGGQVIYVRNDSEAQQAETNPTLLDADLWIDGLLGFGLNRPVQGVAARLIEWLNQQKKKVLAIDVPSGLSCDLGTLGGACIEATTTLALGVLKPAHIDDNSLAVLGNVYCIPLSFSKERHRLNAPAWFAAEKDDLPQLLKVAHRKKGSHKISNGRVLIIAGSRRYPGAGILACLGAGLSGAGMIHACVPESMHNPLLTLMPEIIFEKRIPSLANFDAILLGCGWVPGDALVFEKIVEHILHLRQSKLVLDAGAFSFVQRWLAAGKLFDDNIILTPHLGEFARLFPEAAARLSSQSQSQRINRLEAAASAARLSGAVVLLKGARSHVAHPTGEVVSLMDSSPLLAHAGHGDVLAGLIAGLAALGLESKKAALLAALMQSQTALHFSGCHPAALTLPPTELVRQMPLLPLQE